MAYKTVIIDTPNDVGQRAQQISQFYKGFSSVDESNMNTQVFDFDLVKQDILNHFKTKKNERVMNPNFGSIIWDLLMEPLTDQTRSFLKDDIEYICNYDPRVYAESVDVVEYETGFIIEITLVLKSTDQSSTMKLRFDQNLGLDTI